jgi:hypothetical protein
MSTVKSGSIDRARSLWHVLTGTYVSKHYRQDMFDHEQDEVGSLLTKCVDRCDQPRVERDVSPDEKSESLNTEETKAHAWAHWLWRENQVDCGTPVREGARSLRGTRAVGSFRKATNARDQMHMLCGSRSPRSLQSVPLSSQRRRGPIALPENVCPHQCPGLVHNDIVAFYERNYFVTQRRHTHGCPQEIYQGGGIIISNTKKYIIKKCVLTVE